MTKLILASSSPRRKELLAYLDLPFICQPADVDESVLPLEKPSEMVLRLAKIKAQTVAKLNPADFVIGSDTTVAIEKSSDEFEILGKPVDKNDAFRMLKLLQGRTHLVFTAVSIVCLEKNYSFNKVVTSKVKFISLGDEEINKYISTNEPMDKAGAYALQGIGSCFIESVQGSFTSVIGLPLSEVYRELVLHVK